MHSARPHPGRWPTMCSDCETARTRAPRGALAARDQWRRRIARRRTGEAVWRRRGRSRPTGQWQAPRRHAIACRPRRECRRSPSRNRPCAREARSPRTNLTGSAYPVAKSMASTRAPQAYAHGTCVAEGSPAGRCVQAAQHVVFPKDSRPLQSNCLDRAQTVARGCQPAWFQDSPRSRRR
eukprot:scaffold33561_cov28-Tisochrysis_lutea.AAC.2